MTVWCSGALNSRPSGSFLGRGFGELSAGFGLWLGGSRSLSADRGPAELTAAEYNKGHDKSPYC